MTAESITPRRDVAADSNMSLDILRLLCEEHRLSDREIRARVAPTTLENVRMHLFALCEANLIGTYKPSDTLYYMPTEAGRKRLREINERMALSEQDGGPRAIAWLFVAIVAFLVSVLSYSSCR